MAAAPATVSVKNALLTQSKLNFFYRRDFKIRSRVQKFEENLGAKFDPATTFPVSDEMDPNIARFSMNSKHGFSSINATQLGLQFVTKYSDDWAVDHVRCLKYVRERAELLFKATEKVLEAPICFAGFSTKFQLLKEFDSKAAAKDFLLERFFSGETAPADIEELNFRIAVRYGENLFVNLNLTTVGNFVVPDGIKSKGLYSLKEVEEKSAGLEVLVDVNNRQGFNKNPKQAVTSDDVAKILETGEDVRNEKLDAILASGKFSL